MKRPDSGLFVTGTDTEVGKTYVSCRLLEALHASGIRCGAFKPVASGATRIEESDAYRLHTALQSTFPIEWISPITFTAPMAPPLAAEAEGRTIDESLIWEGLASWKDRCDWLLVEGAGGLCSPISWSLTNADLAKRIGYPLMIVAANKLGVVHQILATVLAANTFGLRVSEIVLNDISRVHDGDSKIEETIAETNERLLRPFLDRFCQGAIIRRLTWNGRWRDQPEFRPA